MSTPCACGSIRDTLVGVAGRQVWQGGWDEANIPTLAARRLPLGGARGGRRPGQVGAHVPSSLAPSCQGFCVMREAGTNWILRTLPMSPTCQRGNPSHTSSPHLLALLPLPLHVHVWPGSHFPEPHARPPAPKDRRREVPVCLYLD